MSGRYIDLLLVAAASGLVGLLEIAERFRDDPLKAIATAPAWVYIGINAGAGAAALLLLRLVDVRFGTADSDSLDRWGRIVAAGFSAVIVLRSTVFVTPEGSGEQSYGLSTSSSVPSSRLKPASAGCAGRPGPTPQSALWGISPIARLIAPWALSPSVRCLCPLKLSARS